MSTEPRNKNLAQHYNDRLLLGIKATMSEVELHWLRNRLLGGKLEKARQGQLRLPLPTGLVYDPTGQVMFDPDEEVQQAVRLLFGLFEELGSSPVGVKQFKCQQLQWLCSIFWCSGLVFSRMKLGSSRFP